MVSPHSEISLENGSLTVEHYFIYVSFVMVNYACIMSWTHSDNMECNDCHWLYFQTFTQSMHVGGEDVPGEATGEGRVCVAATELSPVHSVRLTAHTRSLQ